MLLLNQNFRIGAYIRLSRDDGDKQESESVGNQRKIIERYLKESGLNYFKEYVDDGWSGTTFNRPSFVEMIEDIKANKINMVITKDLSRLGRDYIQTGYYIEKFFPANHIRYVSILDGIDTFIDSTNNDITPFKAILNDMYAKDISKKVKSVLREKQKNGEFMCSTPPYGYKRDSNIKNKLTIDYNVSYLVKKIFEMYDNGIGSIKIVQYLYENKYNPPKVYRQTGKIKNEENPKMWNEAAIMNIIKNEVYIGNLIQNKTPVISYKVKKIRKTDVSEQIRVNNTHEAIIDKDLFDRVQVLANARKRNCEKKYDYLFRGLIYCKHCGRKLQIVLKKKAQSNRQKIPYITCSNAKERGCYPLSMNYYKFEEKILDLIKQICKIYYDEDVFYTLYNKLFTKNSAIESKYIKELKNINKAILLINSKLDTIYRDRLNDIITEEGYKRYSEEFRKNKEILTIQKEELEKRVQDVNKTLEDSPNDNGKLEEYIKEFLCLEKIDQLNLYRLINKIEIDKDKKIYIHFNFSKLNIINQNIDEFIEIKELLNNQKKAI